MILKGLEGSIGVPPVIFNSIEPSLLPLQVMFFKVSTTLIPGLTRTITSKVLPIHTPDVGVIVYVAVAGVLVVFINVCEIMLFGVGEAVAPFIELNGLIVGRGQVYVVPSGTSLLPELGSNSNRFDG